MPHYLLVTLDGDVTENRAPPNSEETINVLDGDLAIYRVGDRGQFQLFTPVDELDTDTWTDVTE